MESIDANATRRQRILTLADLRGDFVTGDDGFVVWWPFAGYGSLTAFDLRALADELDRRNATWEAQIEREIGGG